MCDTEGVYRSLSTAKNAGRQLSTRFFAVLASTNARRKTAIQREEKDDCPLHILYQNKHI